MTRFNRAEISITPDEASINFAEDKQKSLEKVEYEAYPVTKINSLLSEGKTVVPRRNFLKAAVKGGLGLAAFSHIVQMRGDTTVGQVYGEFLKNKEANTEYAERKLLELVDTGEKVVCGTPIEEALKILSTQSNQTEDKKLEVFGELLDMRGKVEFAAGGIRSVLSGLHKDDERSYFLFLLQKSLDSVTKDLLEEFNPLDTYSMLLGVLYETVVDFQSLQALKYEHGVAVYTSSSQDSLAGLRYVQDFYNLFPKDVVAQKFPKKLIYATLPIGAGTVFPPMQAIILDRVDDQAFPHELTHYLSIGNAVNEFGLSSLGIMPLGTKEQAFSKLNLHPKPYRYDSGAEAIIRGALFGSEEKTPEKGYVSTYAYEGGPEEDVAEISKFLFSQHFLKAIIVASQNDFVLQQKLEFITGFRLNGPKKWMMEPVSGGMDAPKQIWDIVYTSQKSSIDDLAKQYRVDKNDLSSAEYFATHSDREIFEYVNRVRLVEVPTFGSAISEKSYVDKGFDGVEFWRKWLGDAITADFFNQILLGSHKPKSSPLQQFESVHESTVYRY